MVSIKHEDVTILDMSVSKGFNGDDVQSRIEEAEKSAGNAPDYIISDNGHNLTKGITGSRHIHHADISHSMGVILKNVYEKQSDFVEFTTLLGKKRLQYHLTDKAYLLPPNMRTISRFMNMSSWVFWGNEMLDCYDTLPEKMQEAYAFIKDYESLLKELAGCTLCCKTRRGHLQERRLLNHDEQGVQAPYHYSCLRKCTFQIGTCWYQDA